MRIIHMSDTHLGFHQLHRVNHAGRNQREQDVYDAFDQAITKTIELTPDAVVHSGDLFDSYHPSSAALRIALDGLRRLREADIPVVVIAGNHSTPRVAAAEHVFGVLERFGGVHVVYDCAREVRIGGLAIHAVAHDNDSHKLSKTLCEARPAPDADFNVLLAHVGLDGLGSVVGSESSSVPLSAEALSGTGEFDYVALGHLHKFAPASNNAAYAGSLERLSWADDAPAKGVVEINLAAGRFSRDYLRLHEIETRPRILLDHVDAAATEDLTAAIISRTQDVELQRAMVRLTVRNVSVADWNAVDHKAIADTYKPCLHFECEPQMIGGQANNSTPLELREFLVNWPGAQATGIDTEEFIARAEAFLARADQEIAA